MPCKARANLLVLILDKTGTVTEGKPTVSSIEALGDYDNETILHFAASIESGSEHPLATAILAAAEEKQIKLDKASAFKAIAGHGITALDFKA